METEFSVLLVFERTICFILFVFYFETPVRVIGSLCACMSSAAAESQGAHPGRIIGQVSIAQAIRFSYITKGRGRQLRGLDTVAVMQV